MPAPKSAVARSRGEGARCANAASECGGRPSVAVTRGSCRGPLLLDEDALPAPYETLSTRRPVLRVISSAGCFHTGWTQIASLLAYSELRSRRTGNRTGGQNRT